MGNEQDSGWIVGHSEALRRPGDKRKFPVSGSASLLQDSRKVHDGGADLSVEEVMEQFDVTREQIAAVLDFVAQSV